jgi:hypothetical protein
MTQDTGPGPRLPALWDHLRLPAARARETLFMANPMHCAVGTKSQGDADADAA